MKFLNEMIFFVLFRKLFYSIVVTFSMLVSQDDNSFIEISLKMASIYAALNR